MRRDGVRRHSHELLQCAYWVATALAAALQSASDQRVGMRAIKKRASMSSISTEWLAQSD
jgi:hypothetical protein